MTDQKQAPERIWIDTFSEKERGPNWNKKPVWAATEYIRKDLHDAAIKQRDELAAEVERLTEALAHWKRIAEDASNLRADKAEAERDELEKFVKQYRRKLGIQIK